MTPFEIIDPLARPDWDTLVSEFSQAGFFHTSAWAKTLHACYYFKPQYLVWRNGFTVKALVPLLEVKSVFTGTRGISLPFSDECEPLLAPDASRSELRDHLLEHGRSRGWRYLECRGGDEVFAGAEPFALYWSHVLDLRGGERTLWNQCSPAMQRAVRKARSTGVTVRKDSSFEAARAFYELQCQTRRKHGLPPQPSRLFDALHQHVVAPGHGAFYLAEHSGRVVAGALFLHAGGKVIFKYGASDESQLPLRANNLLMWQAIADFANEGRGELNFGRTDAENEGLRRYKSGFGAEERPLRYYRFNYSANCFVPKRESRWLRVAQPVFRHMPLPLARVCGALLYRHAA